MRVTGECAQNERVGTVRVAVGVVCSGVEARSSSTRGIFILLFDTDILNLSLKRKSLREALLKCMNKCGTLQKTVWNLRLEPKFF